ncbi:MAG: sporulation initiation factor Spo0A C-terminal domain-containing protein [Oscillospiraceae bacterium]|nr:sporulation initiation factor Spo0A C-terminal domain-containing protein [Oscillospiraceae bacterium]
MMNLQTKVLIDMKDKAYGVKIAANLQRMGIYAIVSNKEINQFETEMMFEKYRIIISDIAERYVECCVQTIIITNDSNMIDMLLFHDSILYISKSLSVESICSLIKFTTDCGGYKVRAERAATRFLRDIGIQVNLKGYKYLRTGIVCTALQPEIMENSTYEIYDVVAKKYGVQSGSVERAMRNSIEMAYERCPELIAKKFIYPIGKPSNTELIMLAADTIRTWVF